MFRLDAYLWLLQNLPVRKCHTHNSTEALPVMDTYAVTIPATRTQKGHTYTVQTAGGKVAAQDVALAHHRKVTGIAGFSAICKITPVVPQKPKVGDKFPAPPLV